MKVNIDASFVVDNRRATTEAIIRDHKGFVLGAARRYCTVVPTAFATEALAIMHGLSFGGDLGFRSVWLESDSVAVHSITDVSAVGFKKTVRDRDFVRDIAVSPLSELPATAAIAYATTVIAPMTAAITVAAKKTAGGEGTVKEEVKGGCGGGEGSCLGEKKEKTVEKVEENEANEEAGGEEEEDSPNSDITDSNNFIIKAKVIEAEAQPSDLCTRREYARWLVTATSILSRYRSLSCYSYEYNILHWEVYPAMYIENAIELDFDDITLEDLDFPSIVEDAPADVLALADDDRRYLDPLDSTPFPSPRRKFIILVLRAFAERDFVLSFL
ncbi:hypothetical protein F3Y22_tig00110511pilonHSYRG00156 [Hibiscus syriacus]|uniref:RNase H type-1 domain-containing protein n=1 Tax=Hibiscus syriacus TaxID=106335 RepID=A0A6A3ACA8_HIBSY|nr:hypothetical protein F3Y22_tig00110511pilonHSYRG00156 [Hibiscus syriacus]